MVTPALTATRNWPNRVSASSGRRVLVEEGRGGGGAVEEVRDGEVGDEHHRQGEAGRGRVVARDLDDVGAVRRRLEALALVGGRGVDLVPVGVEDGRGGARRPRAPRCRPSPPRGRSRSGPGRPRSRWRRRPRRRRRAARSVTRFTARSTSPPSPSAENRRTGWSPSSTGSTTSPRAPRTCPPGSSTSPPTSAPSTPAPEALAEGRRDGGDAEALLVVEGDRGGLAPGRLGGVVEELGVVVDERRDLVAVVVLEGGAEVLAGLVEARVLGGRGRARCRRRPAGSRPRWR